MMGWGSFSSAVGSGGTPRLPWARVWMGLGPPPWADLGVTGVPMGVSGGAGSRGGGILPPLVLSSPVLRLHFSRSITPRHR